MIYIWEEFFINKIEQGLRLKGLKLTPKEKQILLTPTEKLIRQELSSFTPEEAQETNNKCIEALRIIYAQDMAKDKNRKVALLWRENNEAVYKFSEIGLSGIVQNWYLSVGRQQEKQFNKGCLFSVIIAIGAVSALILLIFLGVDRLIKG